MHKPLELCVNLVNHPVSLSEPFQSIGGTITDPIMPAVDPRDPVAQFINKDYRAVMAAIDEKKNHRP
jgi:hypothetical protein